MDDLKWLMEWFASQCDGDWEHGYGITLQTLDNPGWSLSVNLENTVLETRPFAPQEHNLMSDVSWWLCRVKDNRFLAYCGPRDLPAILAVFRTWAEN
jgi:hypothetical protein